MLTTEAVAEIRAAEGTYRASDVARAYEVAPSTITRIWAGERRKGIAQAEEPPNIITQPRPRDLVEDIALLLERGMNVQEVAETLGISVRSVWAYRGVML